MSDDEGIGQAWVIRAGRRGEREQWCLDNGLAGGGFHEIDDLTPFTTREQIAQAVGEGMPDASAGAAGNYTAQLYALRSRVRPGDLVAMPLKASRRIALGRVTGAYEYLADQDDPDRKHVVRVDWKRSDVPRTAVKQDLLFTLGGAATVFSPSRNAAVARLRRLLSDGVDPGSTGLERSPVAPPTDDPADVALTDPEATADVADIARDQITKRIQEEFSGHGLTDLVAAVLTASGLQCTVSPAGPDGGIDILAGRGPLGLDAPRLVAQVKSGDSPVGDPVVNQLHGSMSTQGAEQGLLVAWGGLTRPARDNLRSHKLQVRVWEAQDVVDAVLRRYDGLPDDVRAALPLRRVWMLAQEDTA